MDYEQTFQDHCGGTGRCWDRRSGGAGEERAAGEKLSPAVAEYRNTELGRHATNSKGIRYTNGNYEAFARPKNRRVWKTSTRILSAVDWRRWQQLASLCATEQMPQKTSIFSKRWMWLAAL